MNKLVYDPNSTKNQGRWRLRDPKDFKQMWTEKDKKFEGISYIVGLLFSGEKNIQAIRFDKNIWSEKKASVWWQEYHGEYCKTWSVADWQKWKDWQIEKISNQMKRIRINRERGLRICRRLAEIFKVEYISPNKITIDYKWHKNCLLPVGSIRQGKKELGDIDVIITRPVNKEEINVDTIKDISGGEKRIDFKYFLRDGYVSINIFVFLNKKTWGASLLHSTGPYIYNIRLRNRLHSLKWIKEQGNGWKLSQNGLINNEGKIVDTATERILQKKIFVTERKPKER